MSNNARLSQQQIKHFFFPQKVIAILKQQILEFVQKPDYKPYRFMGLARQLEVPKQERQQLRDQLNELITEGKILEDDRGLFYPGLAKGMLIGSIKRTRGGAGYVTPKDSPGTNRDDDIFIPPEDILDAYSGDIVQIQLSKRRRRGGQRCGRVMRVIDRMANSFVGTYLEFEGHGYVRVDGKNFEDPIPVGDPGAKGASPDDKVVIELIKFPSTTDWGEGVLTHVLGPKGEVGVDTLSIIHEFNLPNEFPEPVLQEARLQAEQFTGEIPADRTDLTKDVIVTIDPVDARDFDDAISLSRDKRGHWHLGVHIADVAHFVQPGTQLDKEAKRRGTSVYLPGQVIPMLPELISNGLASLQQGKNRYAKSAFLEFTPEGALVGTRFANSVINVKQRFAYEQVMPIINDPEKHRGKVGAKVRKLLDQMYELAMILRKRRYVAGSLEMNIPEVNLQFDDQGKVCGAKESEHDASHEIIEEFMLAANIAVATELTDREAAFMRRVHSEPYSVKLKEFAEFVKFLGIPVNTAGGRAELQKILKAAEEQPFERAVSYALLRSMKQAQYACSDMGHYALAVEHYCHFTSPIRRYPDLTVHRLIDSLIKKRKVKSSSGPELEQLAKHCTQTEKRAESAERELTRLKLLLFLEEKVGEHLHATITGVEAFGVFCQGIEYPAEGLVSIDQFLQEDRYYYEQETRALIGQQKGHEYRLGDEITVKILAVDVERREIEFGLISENERNSRSKRKQKPRGKSAAKSKSKKSRNQGNNQTADSNSAKKKKKSRKPKKPKTKASAKSSKVKPKKSKSKSKTKQKKSS